MAVTLKLARVGKKATPHYRVVASVKGAKRDGRFIERLGTYTPITDPPTINLKEDRIRHWLAHGAQVTSIVRDLVRKKVPGLIEELEKKRLAKLQASRKARKTRAKAREKKK